MLSGWHWYCIFMNKVLETYNLFDIMTLFLNFIPVVCKKQYTRISRYKLVEPENHTTVPGTFYKNIFKTFSGFIFFSLMLFF